MARRRDGTRLRLRFLPGQDERLRIRSGSATVRSPPAVPVFTVPAGSNSINDTSASAFGQCSTPRGTTRNSPSPIRTVLSRNCMSKAPCQHQEHLVLGLVRVPDELALELHQLDVLAVQLADDLRLEVIREPRQLVGDVDLFGDRAGSGDERGRRRTASGGPHERIAVVGRRHERLLDRARADPAQQVQLRAGLVVGARPAGAAERLLADDRAGRLVVDVEVAGGVAQRGRAPRGPRRDRARRPRRSARTATCGRPVDSVSLPLRRRRRRSAVTTGPKISSHSRR